MNLDELISYKDADVHIVGLSGAEGTAVLRLLRHLDFTNITVHDRSAGELFDKGFKSSHVGINLKDRLKLLGWIMDQPVKWRTGDDYLSGIDDADLVFLSQGWYLYPENVPVVERIKKAGVRTSSMTELYFDLTPGPIIGVTGSNGKSTTAKLVDEILGESKLRHRFAGNDRQNIQVLHEILDFAPDEVLLLEISNRQLIELDKSPHIGVVTNITPDHISEHGSFEAYVEAKKKIVAGQGEDDFAVLNYDDPHCREMALAARSQVYFFSTRTDELARGAFVRAGRLYLSSEAGVVSICPRSAVRVAGEHNLANVLAAAMAAHLAGVEISAISRGIRSFSGKPLRMEWVAKVSGIDFYNDVKSTTPHATVAALSAFPGLVVLIAGGEDKDLDYRGLVEHMGNVPLVELLPGGGSEKIAAAIQEMAASGVAPKINECATLEEAIRHAFEAAEPGHTVLLSPACASFYSLYMRAPNKGFGAIVKELKKEEVNG